MRTFRLLAIARAENWGGWMTNEEWFRGIVDIIYMCKQISTSSPMLLNAQFTRLWYPHVLRFFYRPHYFWLLTSWLFWLWIKFEIMQPEKDDSMIPLLNFISFGLFFFSYWSSCYSCLILFVKLKIIFLLIPTSRVLRSNKEGKIEKSKT